jgi:ribosomal protein S18 acetylase RimI-like enzyme
MIIRPYAPADKPACLAAFESNMPRFFAPHELEDYTAWLDAFADGDRYYVAEENGEVIGCGGFNADADKQEAFMAWGLIHNAHHKRGLGKALLLFRLRAIRDICPQCIIKLDTTQHSFPFFEKLGFRTVRITRNFYGEGLDRYDMEQQPGE